MSKQKQNVSNLLYFECSSMRELYDCLKSWQDISGEGFLSLNIQQDGDNFCCIAIIKTVELQETKFGAADVDVPNYLDSSMLLLTMDEMKDLVVWRSNAKRWFSKGKGCAVDWENKHLREEIALPIRQKLAEAKNELDIVNAFDLRYAKTPIGVFSPPEDFSV